ncbi:uncharacterized protein LOC142321355 [Lycorma delicatula]|uniref:uncharacterized protein LOC142321355 n=1 Tax=Lycorma delicatula TaxID=130591 RepID=UPI003F50FAB3
MNKIDHGKVISRNNIEHVNKFHSYFDKTVPNIDIDVGLIIDTLLESGTVDLKRFGRKIDNETERTAKNGHKSTIGKIHNVKKHSLHANKVEEPKNHNKRENLLFRLFSDNCKPYTQKSNSKKKRDNDFLKKLEIFSNDTKGYPAISETVIPLAHFGRENRKMNKDNVCKAQIIKIFPKQMKKYFENKFDTGIETHRQSILGDDGWELRQDILEEEILPFQEKSDSIQDIFHDETKSLFDDLQLDFQNILKMFPFSFFDTVYIKLSTTEKPKIHLKTKEENINKDNLRQFLENLRKKRQINQSSTILSNASSHLSVTAKNKHPLYNHGENNTIIEIFNTTESHDNKSKVNSKNKILSSINVNKLSTALKSSIEVSKMFIDEKNTTDSLIGNIYSVSLNDEESDNATTLADAATTIIVMNALSTERTKDEKSNFVNLLELQENEVNHYDENTALETVENVPENENTKTSKETGTNAFFIVLGIIPAIVGGGTIPSPPTTASDHSNSSSSMSSSLVYSPDSTEYIVGQQQLKPQDGRPYLELVENVAPQFRFRYKSEMQGTHGAIQGRSSESSKGRKKEKKFPSVKLCNYNGPAVIRCTLYTADKKSLHVHRLVGKSNEKEKDDPHDVFVGPNDGYVACFQNLVIIHTAKKHLIKELIEKKKRVIKANYPNSLRFDIPQDILMKMEKEAKEETKRMDMNCAVLRFDALKFENNCYVPIPMCEPVYSDSIKNMKSHITGQLKICRVDKVSGSCEGGDEIFLLVEKVGKDNIDVVLSECDENGDELWRDYCTFRSSDVHHQFAIVCRTPKYRSIDINEKVSVKMQLERKSDSARSEAVEYTYKPREDYQFQVTENFKRRRVDASLPSVTWDPEVPAQQSVVSSTTVTIRPKITQFVDVTEPTPVSQYNQNIPNPMWSVFDYVLFDDFPTSGELMSAEPSASSITKILQELPTPDIERSEVFDSAARQALEKGLQSDKTDDLNSDYLVLDGPDNDRISSFEDRGIPLYYPQGPIMPEDEENTEHWNFGEIRLQCSSSINVGPVADREMYISVKHEGCDIPFMVPDTWSRIYSTSDKLLTASDLAIVVINHLERLCHVKRFPHINFEKDILPKCDKILNVRTVHGNSALHTAVMYGQVIELRKLIDFMQQNNRAEYINSCNSSLKTPLHLAAFGGDESKVRMVKLLVAAGADPNKLDENGYSPLHISMRSNSTAIVTCLLDLQETDVNCISDNDGTALHIAAEKNQLDLAKLLLENDADVNLINKKTGRTPLHVAVHHKNLDIVALLLSQDRIQVDKEDFKGCSPLKLSFLDENSTLRKICQLLVKHGANFDDADENVSDDSLSMVENDAEEQLFTKFVKLMIHEPLVS